MIRQRYRRRLKRRPLYRRSRQRPIRRPKYYRRRPKRLVYVSRKPRVRWVNRPARTIRIVRTNEPTTVYVSPGNSAINRTVKEALRRRGLWRGIWQHRLRYPPTRLARFINRFYQVPGFEYVVQDYYGRPYQQKRAKRAIQRAHRLANENSNYRQRMIFNRIIRMNFDGQPRATINVNLGKLTYPI